MTHYWNWIASRTGWLIKEVRQTLADPVERRIALARAVLGWEIVWPALWPASGILGAYVAAGLFGLFDLLPWEIHLLLMMGTLGGCTWLTYENLKGAHLPTWEEGARRVERDSALSHRPISEHDDVQAVGTSDPWSVSLWRVHVKRLLASIGILRTKMPSPGLPARDPHAVRFVVLVSLVLGVVFAGHNTGQRLFDAFAPNLSGNGPPPTMDAWINPPAYTGQAPLYLRADASGTITIPENSQLVVRVHGSRGTPVLEADPHKNGVPDFEGSSGEYAASYKIGETSRISVRASGRELGRWSVRTLADNTPVIAFSEPPSKTERQVLKLVFTAGDDYGVTSVRALITPLNPAYRRKEPFAVDLPLAAASAKTLKQTDFQDLTEHPLAGLMVKIVLEARDGAGHRGYSKAVEIRLPQRVFTDPLARALVEQRQMLALGQPAIRQRVIKTLDALTIAPEIFYEGRGNIYMAIRGAYWGLKLASSREDVERVQDLLWQTALALENGGALLAAQELRKIQQQLSEALAQGAPQEVIDALMQRYQEALQRYLQALAQNAQPSNGQPPPPGANVLSEKDLNDLLAAIQKLAQSGARDSAMQMLALLQSLIENLHMSQGGPGGQSAQDQKMGKAIQDLGELMGRQRNLMDKTFREKQGNPDPKDGGPKGLAQQQGKLHDDMDKVLKDLGEKSPDAFGKAGREMNDAQGRLGAQALDGAQASQQKALEAMREGTGKLAEELMKRNGQQGPNGNEDPLGRQTGKNGSPFGSNVKVPDESSLARARSILEELRRRAAERGRPKEELDYIDRLLKEF